MLTETKLRQGTGMSAAARPSRVTEFGSVVWMEMQRRDIEPTPDAYAVWFAYRLGKNAALKKQLDEAIERGAALTPAVLRELYAEHVADIEDDADALMVSEGASEIGEIANALANDVAGSQTAMAEYSAALMSAQAQVGAEPTVAALVTAVSTLTAETARAVERNQALERKLTASSERISQLRRSLNAVKQEATTDGLTGVLNRRAFDARLKRAMTLAKADPANTASVLLLDVDHFKQFNDKFGHKTGDLVLRLVARLLSDSVKGRDVVARYGGEEFAIILTGAGLDAGDAVGRQICKALSEKRLIEKGSRIDFGQVTLSAGVAQIRLNDTSATLMARADAGLYLAKKRGRNRVCIDQDLAAAPAA